MKALNYIPILALLALASCTSRVYTGLEYDDLYYRKSDQPVASVKNQAMKQVPEENLKAKDYYDNIYAADTLVSDDYSNAVNNNTAGGQTINYYDLDSYSGRLRSFYGNYFDPYWRDPYYYSWGYPSFGWGFGGSSFYDPFYYSPFGNFGYGYGYGNGYGYGYGYDGFYGGYMGGFGYGYNPYYSSWYMPYYSSNSFNDRNPVAYGRRERESNYSSSWNKSMMPSTAGGRRSGNIADASHTPATRSASSTSTVNPGYSRGPGSVSAQQGNRTSTSESRPNYNNANRTYTPSYSNPRMSTRPSYNTSRVSSAPGNTRTNSNASGSGSSYSRNSSSSVSSGQTRSASSYNQGSYSMPARRSVQSGSGYSSGSFGSGRSSSYSSGSESRSSYSSGSSSSSSSYSSGSSSSSSSSGGSRSSSGGSSSGGRR